MSGQPDVFSKGQVVHRGICGCNRKFKMTHYYLQSGKPHPDKMNREHYTSDCNGRAFPVFHKLFRWNGTLLTMAELLLNAGDGGASGKSFWRTSTIRCTVYRIHPNYLRALVPTGLAGAP
jgi:hypothetical protein